MLLMLALACSTSSLTATTLGPGSDDVDQSDDSPVPSGDTGIALDTDEELVEDTDTPADTDVPGDTDVPADTDEPTDTGTEEPPTDPGPASPCPADMVAIDSYCIDRYEAHLVGADPFSVPTSGVAANAVGAVPQGYISGQVAQAACAAAGKRLCTSTEWTRACRGPSNNTYPYGNTYQSGACNEGRSSHPIIELFGSNATWSGAEMNDPGLNQLPDSLAPSGDNPACVTDEGVYDMHGNLHEWIADPAGTFKGGFYVDASINGAGCGYTTTAHNFTYHDYSTGFRCCADQ